MKPEPAKKRPASRSLRTGMMLANSKPRDKRVPPHRAVKKGQVSLPRVSFGVDNKSHL